MLHPSKTDILICLRLYRNRVKIFAGRDAKPGAIIIRQRGRKFYAGENVGMGKDHTIYSKVHGTVFMTKNHKKSNVVHVKPFEEFNGKMMESSSL